MVSLQGFYQFFVFQHGCWVLGSWGWYSKYRAFPFYGCLNYVPNKPELEPNSLLQRCGSCVQFTCFFCFFVMVMFFLCVVGQGCQSLFFFGVSSSCCSFCREDLDLCNSALPVFPSIALSMAESVLQRRTMVIFCVPWQNIPSTLSPQFALFHVSFVV